MSTSAAWGLCLGRSRGAEKLTSPWLTPLSSLASSAPSASRPGGVTGQPPDVLDGQGTAGVLPAAWEVGCPPHAPLHPTAVATRGRSHPRCASFSPRSYFKSAFPAPPLSRGLAGFVSTRLLKDNAQMGALVGGLGWAGRRAG